MIVFKDLKKIIESVSYGKLHYRMSSISYKIRTTKFCRLNVWLTGRNKSSFCPWLKYYTGSAFGKTLVENNLLMIVKVRFFVKITSVMLCFQLKM